MRRCAMFRRSWTHPHASAPRQPDAAARPPRARGTLPTPTLKDDAAHGNEPQFTKSIHTEWFTEWWYFNVRDPKTGLSLLFMYDVTPFGLGIGMFMALVFPPKPGRPFDVKAAVGPNDVEVGYERPDVKVGANWLRAIDDDTYEVHADAKDGQGNPFRFDLTLKRVPGAGPSWLLDNAQGPLDWEVGYWMTFLPHATASGTVTIGDTTYTIEDAAAYHDHNWGVWASPARNWQWLQCSSSPSGASGSSATQKIALDLGYSDGFDPPRSALLDVEGRTIHFEAAGIELPTYEGFRDWPGTPWKYPERAKTTLVSPDERVKVEVEWWAEEDATLPLYASIVLFEQHVNVKLRVYERESASSEWGEPRSFEIDGIAEWSDSYVAEWSTGEGLLGAYAAEATVFGGGISGLTVAHELVERGFAVTVVEPMQALDPKGDRGMAVGGMARSHYARVPRLGPAPLNRPAGRHTPNARDDRWRATNVSFDEGSATVPSRARHAIQRAARAYRDTYCDQGYRMKVTGSASAVEAEPRALAARRAEAVRLELVEAGVAPDLIVLAEDSAAGRPDAVIALEQWVLPGEHGFRFFPAYYKHVTDTMARTPVYDRDGNQTERRVIDNLNPTPEQISLRSGKRPALAPNQSVSQPMQLLKLLVKTLNDNDYDPRDFLQMGIRVSRYLATCPERRSRLESMSWWNYLCGYCPATGCYLYRYSNSFANDATASGRVLAAFDWRAGDARTNGSTYVQLFEPRPPGTGEAYNGTLSAPTTEAWFVHWRKYLDDRGVRFVSGSLENLELAHVNGKDVVIPWVLHEGGREPEPWRPSTKAPHYVVVATDAPTAERVSASLPAVGVPGGLVGYTTVYDGKKRNPYEQPGIDEFDRFQTLSGVQYFFDQDFDLGTQAYSLDSKWAICSLSMQRAWNKLPFLKKDGYAGLLSVDIGSFRVPAGPQQRDAWHSTPYQLAEQIWQMFQNDVRTDPWSGSPKRMPRPTWFHVDDNLIYDERPGHEHIVVKNMTPYLVPIVNDWSRRPGPEPFDPNVPDATRAPPPVAGVWTAPHGGYPVHWSGLVYAGIYLKTFTRMTTMESANESGRHAVNAILDHYNDHHGVTVAPPQPTKPSHPDPFSLSADEVVPEYLGDYCNIWNIERYENPAFDNYKALDQVLYDLGLPHAFDLFGVELFPSVLSHIWPYRGDCSSTTEGQPPPSPPQPPWCPPFVGNIVSKAVRKLRRGRTTAKR